MEKNPSWTFQASHNVQACGSPSHFTKASNQVENVLEALREAGNVPTALQDPAPSAALLSYKESTIEYTLFVWCKAEDYWTTLFDANKNVKAVFAEKNITMTYPHLNVHLDK